MVRGIVRSFVPAAIILALAGSPLPAQSWPAELGLTESAARELLLSELRTGGPDGPGSRLAVAGREAYQKVPEAMRSQVTTSLFLWAKAYVNSPAVKAAYPGFRAAAMPARKQYPRTIGEEMKQQLDDLLAAQQTSKRIAASLPAADRERLLAGLQSQEDLMRAPSAQQAQRAYLEAERAQVKAKEDSVFRSWEERFPPDLRLLLALRLREFLAATAAVDFEARKKVIRGLGGETVGFVEPPEYDKRPWQWRDAFVLGPDATSAARGAAEAWLKEIAP